MLSELLRMYQVKAMHSTQGHFVRSSPAFHSHEPHIMKDFAFLEFFVAERKSQFFPVHKPSHLSFVFRNAATAQTVTSSPVLQNRCLSNTLCTVESWSECNNIVRSFSHRHQQYSFRFDDNCLAPSGHEVATWPRAFPMVSSLIFWSQSLLRHRKI